jgi:ankyrin repeat protein
MNYFYLFIASSNDHLEVVKELINHNADINFNSDSLSALILGKLLNNLLF